MNCAFAGLTQEVIAKKSDGKAGYIEEIQNSELFIIKYY